jgi:hypothetical protein
MALSPLILGEVRDGKLVADDPELLKKAFRCHEGKRVEFQVKRHRKVRSLNQNAYYWAVVVPLIADAMGEDDAETTHEVLKYECNYEMRAIGKGGERREIRYPLSTADLDTLAFEAYCERCRRFAAEFFSIYIPLPNEVAST